MLTFEKCGKIFWWFIFFMRLLFYLRLKFDWKKLLVMTAVLSSLVEVMNNCLKSWKVCHGGDQHSIASFQQPLLPLGSDRSCLVSKGSSTLLPNTLMGRCGSDAVYCHFLDWMSKADWLRSETPPNTVGHHFAEQFLRKVDGWYRGKWRFFQFEERIALFLI